MNDLKQYRVLVTPTSYGKFNPDLKSDLENQVHDVIYNETGRPLSSKQVAAFLPKVHGYIAGLDEIDQVALEAADSLKIIVRYGVGYENVDLAAARQKGIIVSNTPGANATSVAELAMCLILMLARHIEPATQALKQGGWPRLKGLSLEGKTIGIIGLGAIGKKLAQRLTSFNCHLIACDPLPDIEFVEKYNLELVDLETLRLHSDFISLHCPVLPETRHLVNENFLNSTKKGAYLINTARGELIDESALMRALNTGQIAGAALDAFEKEPPDPTNPLLQSEKVICTPHLGAQTDGSTNNMGEMALNECLRVLGGEPPKYQVN